MTSSPADGSPKEKGVNELKLEIAVARDELAETLDAIEDKINIPAKAKRTWRSVKRQYDEEPAPVIATAAISVAVVASAVIMIVRGRRG